MIAGVDEAGRGPLAGPVVAAAVILNPEYEVQGLADSKRLSAAQRERVYASIMRDALSVGVGQASVTEIDALNIFQATLLAMTRAVHDLSCRPRLVQVDGSHTPRLPYPAEAIVKGDATVPAIMAASIVAKVTRDRMMDDLAAEFPQYGFERHRGYPTAAHLATLARYGPCREHRRSFRPVRDCLAGQHAR